VLAHLIAKTVEPAPAGPSGTEAGGE
jgi:hypothetical protein